MKYGQANTVQLITIEAIKNKQKCFMYIMVT